jgi:NAD(P)-dependent dehydrogenase (short-subunit alcohol dehydrogenase family)
MSSVLVTGCSSGFGLLTALTFARRGDRVIATVRDPATAGALAAARDGEALPLTVLPLDVRDTASVRAAVGAALDGGAIDVLVNNAGFALRCAVEEVDDDELLAQFDTNLFGVVRLIRAVAPGMREQGSGTIVNVSSLVATAPQPFGGLYAASKAAVSALSEALHYELAPFGVRVVLVEPGSYPTRFARNALHGRHSTSASAYDPVRRSYGAALTRLLATVPTPDPQEVADSIHRAVYAGTPRFRHVVGARAQQIAAARQTSDFEEFERFWRARLDWPDPSGAASPTPAPVG